MCRTLATLSTLALIGLGAKAQAAEPWQQAIAVGLGKPGAEMPGGAYRIGQPRTDLKVKLDGVELKPSFALGSWLAFVRHGGSEVMVMGDFVLTAEEVNPVLRTLRANGIEVTAIHNHMLADEPRLFFMHFWANDDAAKLAQGLKTALEHVRVAKS